VTPACLFTIRTPEGSFVSSFINGVAVVGNDGKFKLINKKGETISIYDNEASTGSGSLIGDLKPEENNTETQKDDDLNISVPEEKKEQSNIAATIVICITLLMVLLIAASLSVRAYNIHMRKKRRRAAIENLKKRNTQNIYK